MATAALPQIDTAIFKSHRAPYVLMRPDECPLIQFHDGEFRTQDPAQIRFLLGQSAMDSARGGHPGVECTFLPAQFADCQPGYEAPTQSPTARRKRG